MSHAPRFPTPTPRYDPQNEAQFRAQVYRAIQGSAQLNFDTETIIEDGYTEAIDDAIEGLPASFSSFIHDIGFAATDYRTVTWAGGDFELSDGTTYTIASGTTGNMTGTTYIYLDTAVSTTALQTTTSASNSVGSNKWLMATANINGDTTKYATYIVFGGGDSIIGTFIGTNSIATGAITANEIAAQTITANEIASNTVTAGQLAAGTITANEIALGTITGDRLDSSITTVDELPDGSIMPPFVHTVEFSATDDEQVEWAAGDLELTDGTSYTGIVAGNTGTMTTTTYVYFDPNASTTVLQTTTSAVNAVGDEKWLLAVCNKNSDSAKDATFIVYGGGLGNIGTFIGTNSIATGAITANEVAANTITAAQIAAGTITATEIDAQTITANEIALGTITGDRLDSGITTVDELPAGSIMPPFIHTVEFSATDYQQVEWAAGDLELTDGTSYTGIVAGNTGTMTTTTYVYFDPNASTTVLQTTTSAVNAVGNEKWLIAVCNKNSDSAKDATFIVYGGGLGNIGTFIGQNSIATGAVTANEIASNTITAGNIFSLLISGVTLEADTGTIGGWTMSASDLSSGSFKINASNEQLLIGSATAPLTGAGIFIGKNGADYELRAGDPSGEYIHWDGTNLIMNGTIAAGSDLNLTEGDGISISAATSTISLDIDGLTDIDASGEATLDAIGTDQIAFARGSAVYKDTFNTINLSIFNDDLGYTQPSGGDGINITAGAVVSIDGSSGGAGLFRTAWDNTIVPVATDALIIGDGGVAGAAEIVQLMRIPLGLFNDAGYAQVGDDETITGAWTFSNDLTLEATVPRLYFRESDQAADEKVYRMVVTESNFKFQARNDADTANTDIFEVDRGAAEAVNAVDFHVNIRPADANRYLGTSASRWDTAYIDTLVLTNDLSVEHGGTGASSFANDELLIGGGGTNAVTTDSYLSFSGGSTGQLNAPYFSGNGQNLTDVPSETVALQAIGTGTRYVLMTPDASGQAQVTVDDADLFWTISSNTLTAANLDVTGTIVNAEWQGDVIASAYLDADTAHLSGTQTFTGTKSFSDGIRANGWLHLQNETSANDPTSALAGYQTLYSYDNGSTFELRTIVSDSPNPDLVRNIPLVTGSAANDQLLVSTGTDHEADWSGDLTYNASTGLDLGGTGLDISISGTGRFEGDGSGLTDVAADTSTVTDLTTETNTYYPMMADGTSGSVSHFVDASELSYTSSTDTLNLVSAIMSGDLTVDTSTLVVDSTNDRVGIATANPYSALDLGPHDGSQISWHTNSTTSYAHIWASRSGARLTLGHGVMGSTTVNNGFNYSTSNTWARSALELSYGQINFYCNPADSGTYGSAVAMDRRMYLSTDGFGVDVGSDHFKITRDSASTAQLELNNTSGDRGYLQATNAGAVTLATQVAGGQINLRDNGNGLNLIQADYNGTDTVRINSNGNNTFAINATGSATSATMRWRFGGTDEARIQWLDSSNQLRFRLEDSSDRVSVYIGGASAANDRRFDIRGIADHEGVVSVENAQFFVDEDNTTLSISSGVVTCNWDRGNQLHLDLDSTVTEIDIVDNKMYAGGSYILMISEGTSAPASVTWTTTDPLYWANGDEPVLNAGDLNDITVVQFFKTEAGDDRIIGSWFMAQ
jgi:hypothetical protein